MTKRNQRHITQANQILISLGATYDEWVDAMPDRMAELERLGLKLHKIDVAIDELVAWCRANKKAVDGEARAEYTTRKCRELDIQGELG